MAAGKKKSRSSAASGAPLGLEAQLWAAADAAGAKYASSAKVGQKTDATCLRARLTHQRPYRLDDTNQLRERRGRKPRIALPLRTGRNLRPVQGLGFVHRQPEHEVGREARCIALDLLIQPLGRRTAGQLFNSPSQAGTFVRKKSTNGWNFWRLETDGRRPLREICAEYLRVIAPDEADQGESESGDAD